MRREKPHQQYYKPGSGPLRKSAQGSADDFEGDNSVGMGSRDGHGRNFGGGRSGKNKSDNTDKLNGKIIKHFSCLTVVFWR